MHIHSMHRVVLCSAVLLPVVRRLMGYESFYFRQQEEVCGIRYIGTNQIIRRIGSTNHLFLA